LELSLPSITPIIFLPGEVLKRKNHKERAIKADYGEILKKVAEATFYFCSKNRIGIPS
jgi:hypothetical protein